MWQTILGTIAALGLSGLLARQFLDAYRTRKETPQAFFRDALPVLEEPRVSAGATAGSAVLSGGYRGFPVTVQTVVDTLNVRKLPSLWLMVTVPEALPVKAIFDLMMRPSGPTTFSNFDGLPFTIDRPPDFPELAVIRSDDPEHMLPPHVIAPYLQPFFGPRAKELLITPKGLRMVIQMGEADRARYGVFRQAEFGNVALDAALLRDILDRLVALREATLDWYRILQ